MKRINRLSIFFFLALSSTSLATYAETPKPLSQDAHPSTFTASTAPLGNQLSIPPVPDINAKGYVIMDATSGTIIAQKNMDQRMAPASLTKMMTLYLIDSALHNKQITLDTLVPISKTAWQTGGSRMFVQVGTQVPVHELVQGIIVDSGNDATMAMAEFLAGSAATFPALMNQQAERLGMKNTHYTDPTGLPDPDHYSSPHDIAILARALQRDFPQYYDWFKQKTFTYNKITQSNRNKLLWRDPSVDGIKTGFTDDAGYCLVSSAQRNGTRFISVVMGAPRNQDRYEFSAQLLNYAFRFYQTFPIYRAGTVISQVKTWYGQKSVVPVTVQNDLSVTVPAGSKPDVKADVQLEQNLRAPIQQGQQLGQITITVNGKTFETEPLVAASDNPKGGVFKRMADGISLMFHKIF